MLLFVAFASLALFAEACDPISVYCALTPIMRHNVQIRVNRDPVFVKIIVARTRFYFDHQLSSPQRCINFRNFTSF